MEILDAYDLTGSLRDAAELVGCSHHTVKRYVEARDKLGGPPSGTAHRSQLIDDYLANVEEWVERSKGRSAPTGSTRSWSGWGSPGRSGPPAARSRSRRPRSGSGTAGSIGRG